jgi:hypothetical protein
MHMTDPIKEIQAYRSRVRASAASRDGAIENASTRHAARVQEARKKLSPGALAMLEAYEQAADAEPRAPLSAEEVAAEAAPEMVLDGVEAGMIPGSIPKWMEAEPKAPAPMVVEHDPKRRAR